MMTARFAAAGRHAGQRSSPTRFEKIIWG